MPDADDKPHYHGHRDPLRERFMANDGDGLPDYELLELLLSLAIPRRDVKPIAKALIEQFGSLGEVLSADPKALTQVKGIGDSAAALKIVRAAGLRLSHRQVANREVIGSWDNLLAYCKAAMGYERVEQLRILFLDRKNVLIADEVQQRGTVDHTPLYPREVVKRALELGASALILVHNHPSGDPNPSKADIDMARQVKDVTEKLGIALHDHVVIGKGRHVSFRAMGLLDG
jgi:DNA repair protein RadC